MTPPTDEELETILATVTPKYRALVLIAAIGGLGWGEATPLRAADLTTERNYDGSVRAVRIAVARGMTRTKGELITGSTKTHAVVREVAILGDDAQIIAAHSRDLIGDALLFPAPDGQQHLSLSTFHRHCGKARRAAGRSDMPLHALRHYAGTTYAQTGATVRETTARLGHASTAAAMCYQHSGTRGRRVGRPDAAPSDLPKHPL